MLIVLTVLLSGMRSSLSLRDEETVMARAAAAQEAENAAAVSAAVVSAATVTPADAAEPTATAEPTPTATPTATAEPTPTATPTATAEPTSTAAPTEGAEPAVTPVSQISLSVAEQTEHPALMSLEADGLFHGENCMTRGQFCLLLAALLDHLPEGTDCPYPDVSQESGAYSAIASLYMAGLLTEAAGESFSPGQYVQREWAADILTRLASCLSGAEQTRVEALGSAVASGTTSESGAADSGNELLRRDEIAVILVRLAGRDENLDEDALFFTGNIPADMDMDSWAWAYVTDALTEGAVETAEPGVHRVYGWLYAAWDDGTIMRDMDYGVWTFGLDGRYTTGNEELDEYLAQALEESGANDLPEREEALAAVYLYVKENFEYLVMAEDMTSEDVGTTGWEYARALRFFQNGGGTCYGYAATFGILARLLGETAYIVAGQVNQFYGAHSWVVIPEDGIDWIYDVELEDTRSERHGELELFHIQNYMIYNYWYEPDW